MTDEEKNELLVAGRRELAHALRQWEMYANERRADYHDLGHGDDLEDRFYKSGREILRRLGAAADELDDASLARKTAFVAAPGSETLAVGEVTVCPKCKHPNCQTWERAVLNLAYANRRYNCVNCGQFGRVVRRAESPNAKLTDAPGETSR